MSQIQERMESLGVKQVDLILELRKRGITVQPPEMSSINDVDKTFYIDMAKKRINDFLGIKPEKKTRRKKQMATTTTKTTGLNVYQKLIEAREKFLVSDVNQSGKNYETIYSPERFEKIDF